MAKSALVSVILPTFNRLRYLPDAVASVFGQTFQDWELLIADDGSGQETQDYLRTLDDRLRVRVLWLSHTGNPAAVRNAALREARGEYVAFLDSDDVWMPEKLQTQIESLHAHIVREWSYTGFTLVDDSGSPLTGARATRGAAFDGRILDALVNGEALVVTPSVVVRRKLIEKVGGYNDELLVCEDYELWMRLASCSEVDFIDRPLVLVRRHGEHSFDDVTCLENLMRAMAIVQRSGTASHLDAVLNCGKPGESSRAEQKSLSSTDYSVIQRSILLAVWGLVDGRDCCDGSGIRTGGRAERRSQLSTPWARQARASDMSPQ